MQYILSGIVDAIAGSFPLSPNGPFVDDQDGNGLGGSLSHGYGRLGPLCTRTAAAAAAAARFVKPFQNRRRFSNEAFSPICSGNIQNPFRFLT